MKKNVLFLLAFAAFSTAIFAQKEAETAAVLDQKIDPKDELNTFFKPMKWRCIGPLRGGRSVAATGVLGDPMTYFMGTTGGGLWKTDDAGITWANVSDGFFKTATIGAVAVAENDPNVVFCGTGEHAVRGVMTHSGDGVYKSTDAGRTWQHTGLADTRHISRICIHPTDANTVFVAAQGHLYGKNTERGVFKTSDGGATWRRVLYIDEKTGCVELSMDAQNPRILYAAMNEYGRSAWKVTSGGPTSGLFKSVDAGETWQKIESENLPKPMGKAAIAVARSNAQKVWALIEGDSEKGAGGLFSSADAGKTWTKVSGDNRLVQRAWYYIELFVDPFDENKLYVLSAPALVSKDGGKSWEELQGQHGDYHNLWINPRNPKNIILADDGGAVITQNGGKSWTSQGYATAQFYRINADNHFPYRIYGGQQDNSSVRISSRELNASGISTSSWTYSAGGESAFLAFDPDDPRLVLGGSYQGTIDVFDSEAQASTNVMAAPIQYLGRAASENKYRFNWNAPIIWSKWEKNAFFHGSQTVLKTTDFGRTWSEISPDLTRNEKAKQGKGGGPLTNEAVGAENYGTLSYLIEGLEKGQIWAGSDDGLVHLTRDGGATWQNVTPKGLEECLINAIEPSPFDAATAYVATTRFKFDDHRPGLFKTTDFGKTWSKIDAGLPENAFTRVVREDPKRRDFLVCGTELGLFCSFDGGKTWSPFQLNLPKCPITDLKFHQNDLIAATSGRSFWVLDDLQLLQNFEKGKPLGFALFPPENAVIANGSSALNKNDDAFDGAGKSEGVNPANGIVLYYHLPDEKTDILNLEIRDEKGQIVRSFSSKKDSLFAEWEGGPPAAVVLSSKKGLNRFVWDGRSATISGVPNTYFDNSFLGHKCPPAGYVFELKRGAEKAVAAAQILPNPLYKTTPEDYAAQHFLMSEMEAKLTEMHDLINQIDRKRSQIEEITPILTKDEKAKTAREAAEKLTKKMKTWDEEMVQRKSKAYDDVENFPNKFTANYLFLHNQTDGDLPRVNQPNLARKAELDLEWLALKKRAAEMLETDLPALNRLFWEAGVGGVWKN